MYQLILIVHVLAAVCLIGLVLVQQGKGATVGAAFGSGASQTVFGSRGSGSFLMRITIGLALLFFATSIILNNISSHAAKEAQAKMLDIHLPGAADKKVPVGVSPSSLPAFPAQSGQQHQ